MAEILTDFLADVASRAFKYGEEDCASFVVEWFDRLTGRNGLKDWRGRYGDAESCAAYIRQHGGFTEIASAFFASHYGAARAAPKAGNAVLARFKGQEAMGVRVDDERIALRPQRGVLVTHRATPLAEWSV